MSIRSRRGFTPSPRHGVVVSLWMVFSLLLSPVAPSVVRARAETAPAATVESSAGRAWPSWQWPVSASVAARAAAAGRPGLSRGAQAGLSAGPALTETATLTPTLPTDPAADLSGTATLTATLSPTPEPPATAPPTATPSPDAGPTITGTVTPTLPSATATPTETPQPAATPPAGIGRIQPETGGRVRSADGRVALQFPAGAVAQAVDVSHQALAALALPPDRHLFYRFELSARAVDRPELTVTEFAVPVTVTVAYSQSEVLDLDEAGLRLVSWDEARAEWQPVSSTLDTQANLVTARLWHFSQYALEGDDEVYFLPRIEAGQVALLTGDSSFSYELEVPAGAGGLKVPLTLTYSGGIPNGMAGFENTDTGWVGVGWTLEVGSISDDGGQLTLNGQSSELIWNEAPKSTVPATESDWDGGTYSGVRSVHEHWLREQQFFKIESDLFSGECVQGCPVGSVEGKGHWDVWDRSGVHYTFGSQAYAPRVGGCEVGGADPVECGTGSQLSSTDSDAGRRLYRVYKLDGMEDPHGNRLTVEYDVYPVHKVGGLNLKESYPAHIQYTTNSTPGAVDNHAEYEIEFLVVAKDHDVRADKRVAETGYLLQEVKVWAHPDLVHPGTRSLLWKYVLGYFDYDEANREHYRLASITRCANEACTTALPATAFAYYYDTSHQIGWLEGGQNRTAPRPFLQTVTNGYGGTLSYGYQTWSGSLWTQRQLANAKTVAVEGGTGQAYSYSYQNADIETQGGEFKSFIGFESVTEENTAGNRRQVTRFHDTNGYARDVMRGKVLEEWTRDLQNVEYGYRKTDYDDGREAAWNAEVHFIYTLRVTERECGSGVCGSKKTEYEYNTGPQNGGQYGNLTAVKEYASESATTPYRTTRRWTFPNTGAWILDRLASEGEWVGEWGVMRWATWYYYDGKTRHNEMPGTKGELTRVQRLFNNRVVGGWTYWDTSETTYGYDAYGNRTTETVYAGYGQMRQQGNNTERVTNPTAAQTTTIEYDGSHHSFARRVTNALSQVTETEYYEVNEANTATGSGLFGQVKGEKEANNVWVWSQYDGYGRLQYRWLPGDTAWATAQAGQVYGYDQTYGDGINWRRVWQRDDAGSSPTYLKRWEFYDGLGRPVQSQGESEDAGKVILVNRTYDALGRPAQESLPYEITASLGTYQAPDWSRPKVSTAYDVLGRETRLTNPDASYVQTGYKGWERGVVDENGHQKVYRSDAFGRLASVSEYTGSYGSPNFGATAYATTNYGYDEADRLVTVTDAANNTTTMVYDQLGRKKSMADPDMGQWAYEYDAVGNLKQQDEARNVATSRTCLDYDLLNRLVGKYYRTKATACAGSNPNLAVRYGYDAGTNGKGHRTSMMHGELSGQNWIYDTEATWAYDNRGRLTEEQKVIDDTIEMTFVTTWEYDKKDRVKKVTYPDEEQVTTGYNEQGLPETLTGSQTLVDGANWDAAGQPELWTFGGTLNLQVKWEYYSDDRRLQWLRGGTSGTPGRDLELQYVYDNVGNVTQISDKRSAVTQIQTFTYDALDRLTQGATSGAGTWGTYSESYAYNAIGNLTSKGGATYNYPPSGVGSVRPHAVTGTTGPNAGGSFEYDANGNMTSRLLQAGGTTYGQVWDAENRLVSVTAGGQTTTFTYDGDGALVKKVAGGQTTVYVGNYYEKQGTAVIKYYYFAGRRVAMRTASGLSYLAGDHLGTTSLTWNSSGVKVAEARHLPYGGERWTSGTMPTDYRFTGQRLTVSLGLYQMGARWYDGALGRWLSADTIVPAPEDPQSLNRYSYVGNRPLVYIDPTGHKEDGECGLNGEDCSDDLSPPSSDPEFLTWLTAQSDNWLWENIPSAVGDYLQLTVTGGAFAEGEISVQIGAMFNWRTGELTFLYGLGPGVYLGTPRGMSASVSGGGMFTWGASESASLMGVDAYYGANAQIDAVAEVGVEMVGSTSLYYDDVNDNGRLDLHDNPAVFVDPVSHRPVNTLQVGLNVGANGLPNAVDAGVVGGVSVTAGFNIISGWDSRVWPWNW